MRLLSITALVFFLATSHASSIHYYAFDRVELSDADVTIRAELTGDKEFLKFFKVTTSELDFDLSDALKKEVVYPKLNSISYELVPYDIESGGMHWRTIYLSFYGDFRCGTGEDAFAPEDKLVIIFGGKVVKTHIVRGKCDI